MKTCENCKSVMKMKVCKSNAGYYIGYWCDRCGPYERLSVYYPTKESATIALNNDTWIDR